MREAVFVQKNKDKWQRFELMGLNGNSDLAQNFIELTDDLAYAQTFYPGSDTVHYLNGVSAKYHQLIYKNKRERGNRFVRFWQVELPSLLRASHRQLFYSFLIFTIAMLIGAFSAANDDNFVRLILGDSYVNMTLENIENGDPMGVYKKMSETEMFLAITVNNIRVSFIAFAAGLFFSLGTVFVLFQNGIMLGAFQYFFFQKGLLLTSFLTIWIHGTLEISAIIIAGCAGLVMGNSILFPGTYTRLESFKKGARQGLKIVVGLVPIFIAAGFLEGFVTRHTEMPVWLSSTIITCSAAVILLYFVFYPIKITQKTSLLNDKNKSSGRT